MAHQVERMFFVGETPWHGLGHYFPVAPKTLEEILPAAGLDWHVVGRPLYDEAGYPIATHKQLVRSDNGAQLGIVGNKYCPMQNTDALAALMPLIESGEAEIETAGSLKEGKKVWALLRSNHLHETTLSNGEQIRNFFLFSTAHDGTRANRFGKTSVRVVCANTLAMSDADSAVVFRHTKQQKAILDTLVDFAVNANKENEAMANAFEMLMRAKCSDSQLEDYIKQVMNLTDSSRAQNVLDSIKQKAYWGKGMADLNGSIRHTWWAALNAITEHLSHEAGRTAENRYNSLWFGSNQGLLNKATTLALKAIA